MPAKEGCLRPEEANNNPPKSTINQDLKERTSTKDDKVNCPGLSKNNIPFIVIQGRLATFLP